MNVFEVGTKLIIKNLEFSFYSLSALTCSPGSVEHSFLVGEKWLICRFTERFFNNSLCLSLPFPTKIGCHSTESVKCYKSLLQAPVRHSL